MTSWSRLTGKHVGVAGAGADADVATTRTMGAEWWR